MIPTLVSLVTALLPLDSAPTPTFEFGGLLHVLHDQDEFGRHIAVGNSYKLIVDSEGARYYPRFGARAERNFPIHFAFPGTPSSASRIGDRIVIERQGFTEIYDLSLDVVEQSFLVPKRFADGDLDFRIPLLTDLPALESAGSGLRFGRDDLGEVVYGDATILDAAGNRVHAKSQRIDGAIRIVVPDVFLDRAVFPIVIDPLIETIPVDTGTDNMRNPDVAYSESLNVFVVVYERVNSAVDTDLLQRRYEVDGDFLDLVLLAGTADSETEPAVAHAGGNFMTAWFNIDSVTGAARIKGRNRVAGSSSLGSIFNVSGLTQGETTPPDIGGTSASTPFPFFVVYGVTSAPVILNNDSVASVRVSSAGNTEIGTTVSASDPLTHPRVNQHAKAGGVWLVTYEMEDNPLFGGPEHDIGGVVVDPQTGTSLGTPFVITDSANLVDATPDVGGDGIDLLVAWSTRASGADADLVAQRYRWTSSLTPLGGAFSLTALDHTGNDTLDQLDPQVGYDGVRFVVGYRETAPGFDTFDLYASTFFATGTDAFSGSQLALEKHATIAKTSTVEIDLAITSCGIDQAGLHLLAWTQQIAPSNRDVISASFSSLGAGGDAVTIQTGCGSPEPALVTSSQAVIGAPYQIIVNATNPLLLIGFQTSVPMCPGQGGCVLGVSPITMIPVPVLIQLTIPADPVLLGAPFALQIIDLLPTNATGALCGPPKYAQKFRVSDTRVTTIR